MNSNRFQETCLNEVKNTFDINAHFIAPNPTTTFNSRKVSPRIDATAYVGPFSTIIGDVIVKNNVFIAPNVSIRADEGYPIVIDSNTNLQDGVILHGLEQGRVRLGGKEVSIYVGKHVSCAHGCIVHGPCKIGNHVFIGFNAIVLDATIGDGCFLSINSFVTGGVNVPPNRFVPTGAVIDTQKKADCLRAVTREEAAFAKEVQDVNTQFPQAYARAFGKTNDSCTLSCR